MGRLQNVRTVDQAKLMLVFLNALLVLELPPSLAAVCPSGYNKAGDICYSYHSETKNWSDARAFCKRKYADLIYLDNWNNFSNIRDIAKKHGSDPWVGAHDVGKDSWMWVNGRTLSTASPFWAKDEPNHTFEDCVEFYGVKNFYLNNLECHQERPFFCEANACPDVQHCKTVQCTVKTTSVCTECDHHKYFYKPTDNSTKCEQMCAWNNHYCWPGICADELLKNCQCIDGFYKRTDSLETTCQPRQQPSIETCSQVAIGSHGEKKMSETNGPTNECRYQANYYGNYKPVNFQFKHVSSFQVNASSFPTKPSFIKETNFGITNADIEIYFHRVTGTETSYSTTQLLVDSNSILNVKPILSREGNITMSEYELHNGDRLCLKHNAYGGGFLVAIDKSKADLQSLPARPYVKTKASNTVCYLYDNVAPQHCLELNNCTTEPLRLETRISRTPNILVEFQGWIDPPPVKGKPEYASSIESYEIRVNEVSGNVKLQVGTKPIFTKKVKITTNSMVLNISSSTPKLFCVTLEVKDVANNVRQARRFFLYDNSTSITSRKEDRSFYISSASIDTNYTWQTHRNDICLNWTNHFYNEFYLRNKLLEKIESDSHGLINGIYEQNSGILPVTGTQNFQGIIQFKFSYSKNHSNFSLATTVLPLDAQTFCKSFNLTDGDTFRLKIDATDIVKNSVSEIKTVHIDRSVPQINNIWLEKDGYKSLFVHDQTDLSKMDLQFDAYDPHSGIKRVDWFISTFEDEDHTIESGSVGVQKIDKKTCSVFDKCYCPVIGKDCESFRYSVPLNILKTNNKDTGDHNRNYYFTVKAINNANLFNIEHMDILIDDSPPETGVVLEGPEDGPDIDYTSSDEFLIHWHGFIDHESGIKLYRVALAETCLTTQDFQNFNQHNATSEDLLIQDVDASEFTLRLPANFTGKRYTSVIAFNNAMEPSVPACSDGITKDTSPPNFHNVTLANAKWAETLYCQENKTWFLRSDLVKVDISEGQACKQTCDKTQNISFIESIRSKNVKAIKFLLNTTSEIESFGTLDGQRDEYEFICSTFPVYDLGNYIYLPDDQILLQWDAADEFSQISDFFIGFGRSASEDKAPSLISYISTSKKSLFKLHHAGIGTDEEFFIFLKGVNKAGLEIILPIGPVLIDQTPPRYRNAPDVSIDADEIVVGWENDTFYDDEQSNPINLILFQIGHENTMVTPVLEWRLESSMRCAEYSGGCVKYPLVKLQKQDTNQGLSYHILLHIYNNAGHFITVKTAVFKLPSVYPPGQAVVLDVDPMGRAPEVSLNVIAQDVDAHFTENTVCASWSGFSHKEGVKIEFGIGTSDRLDDKIAFKEVNNTGFYCLTSSLIPKQEKVFVRLRATCSGGSTISNSNGVIIYEKTGVLNSLQVFDGPECFIASHMVEQLQFAHVFSPADTIRFNYSFTVGNLYSMRLISNNQTSLGLKIQSPSIIIVAIKTDDFRYDITFQPTTSFLENTVVSFYNRSVYIKTVELYDCHEDISLQQDLHKISAHWSGLADDFTYQYALISTYCPDTDNQSCIEHITPFETTSKSSVVLSGLQLNPHTNYYIAVKPCLNGVCQRQKVSSGVYIDQDITSLTLLKSEIIVDTDNCTSICILWQSSDDRIKFSFYQWSISIGTSRSDASYRVVSWQTILNTTGNFHQVHECLNMSKKHALKTLYVCVRAFTSDGVTQQSCQVIKTTQGQQTTNTVYEFDTSSVSWNSIKELLHSYYLGDKLTDLHDNEVDFGTRSTKIAGAIPYGFGRNITWYLMKERSIPSSCKNLFNCISSITTTSGYAKFPSHEVALYTVHYICAVADEAEIERESSKEILSRISSCSDGFLIDDMPPSAGEVTVDNMNGYINNVADFRVSWSNFEDNIADGTLGYRGSIHYYAVLLGSVSGGRSIRQYDNLGEDTSLTVKNLTIEDGAAVFVSVTAVDHAGLNTTVTSEKLVVDTSPPMVGKIIKEGFSHTTWVSSNILRARLVGFEDSESGIDYFVAYIGSSKNTDDVMHTKSVKSDRLEFVLAEETIIDGHAFFLGVKAVNRAGLSSEYVYLKFAVDRSPPTGGHLIDGSLTDQKDVDYQTSVDYVSGHWTGFVDPHSGISHYRVGLGTHPYSDDIEPLTSTGLRTYVIWNSTFTPGEKYFMTVEACNGAFVCRSLSSDGIILDNSSPIRGLVRVGSFSSHQTYIHKNSSVEIFWTGFEDPQSGLDHFEACIGTVPGKCDITPNFNCLLASSHIKTGLDLPRNTDLFVTVTAYNKVNMNMSEASNHFRVDSSPPIIQTKPKFFRNYTSYENVSAQWEKSLLRISWKFIDPESPIVRHVVTLVTHHEGHTPVEHIEIGLEDKLTISLDDKHWLHNGDTYKVMVTACNAAGLCTTAESETLLIDSTPPHIGGFKPPMSWHNFVHTSGTVLAEMNLTWYGFHDQESGIKHFYIGVGKSYSGNELSNGLVRIAPNTRLNIYDTSLRLNEPLLSIAKVVVSIVAENNAGLMSSISRVTLTTLPTTPGKLLQAAGGLLEIEKHSCDIHFCNKDCTCAVIGQPCAFLNTNSTCHSVNSTADNPFNLTVNVYGGMRGEIVNITASSSCLAGHWIVANGKSSIKRFEWSLGIKDYNPGEGIFDSNELSWQDIGTRTEVVHCLSQNRSLIHGTEYVAYVRVWVEADQYLVFKSPPIMVDHTAPAVRKGAYVKDSDSTCVLDFDVIDWADHISACWNGLFNEPQGRIVYYKIALGTSLGADDVLAQMNVGLNTTFNARKLHLSSGRRYFFTVTAYNNVGLHKAISSDGFLVDMEIPNSGVVYNTKRHRNYDFHSSMASFDLSWHGFLDHDSGIRSYFAALVEESENNTFVTNFSNVGLHTHIQITNLSLVNGRKYFGAVKAIDAANHESALVYSKSKLIDTTAPAAYICRDKSVLHEVRKSNRPLFATLERNAVYIVSGIVSMSDNYPFVRIKVDREYGHSVPLEVVHDGTFRFRYSSSTNLYGNHSFTVESDISAAVIEEAAVSKCVILPTYDPSYALHVTQISSHMIKASVRVLDPESSIKRILLAAGTKRGGVQHKSFYQIDKSSDEYIPLLVPHGTPVYITAVVENYAGLRSTFHSKRIIVDHTPPVIEDVNVVMTEISSGVNDSNVTQSKERYMQLKATWNATDIESGIKLCFVSVGSHMYLDDIQKQELARHGNLFVSSVIAVSHGKTLFVNIKCVNNVELATAHEPQPVTVSVEPPTAVAAKVYFVPSVAHQPLFRSNDINVFHRPAAIQTNKSRVQFFWDGFEDDSGIDHYEYRLSSADSSTAWTDAGIGEHVSLDHLKLVDGQIYTAEVRAVNKGQLRSNVVNANIIVDSRETKLTGQPLNISVSGRNIEINWAHVFRNDYNMSTVFDVTIGSTKGSADIIDKRNLETSQMSVSVPKRNFGSENVQELFISVSCWHSTGLKTTYKTNFKLPF